MIRDHVTTTEAVIYLKGGKRKYGVLIENDEVYDSFQFISNDKMMDADHCMEHIECLSADLIGAIDINLK